MFGETPGAEYKKIRYAVVGLGHIAQAAVLPAFQHAAENSELAAVISSDEDKRRALSTKYKVRGVYRSSAEGRSITIKPVTKAQHLNAYQDIQRPPVKAEPELVHVSPPHK